MRATLALFLVTTGSATWPVAAHASQILYTLDLNFSAVPDGLAPQSVVDVSFLVPSVLTSDTVVTSLLSQSVGGSFTGCVVASVNVPGTFDLSGPYIASAMASFVSECSTIPGEVGEVGGALGVFEQSLTSPGTYTAY
jgi:hypothetical protein